jgi:hypothetical protein
MNDEARRLRADAARAHASGDLRGALSLYEAACDLDLEDPIAPHRAGEILRRMGRSMDAIQMLHQAAGRYVKLGFPVKAIAVCKIILQLDPNNLETQYELWMLDLQRRTGQVPAPAAKPPPPQRRPPMDSELPVPLEEVTVTVNVEDAVEPELAEELARTDDPETQEEVTVIQSPEKLIGAFENEIGSLATTPVLKIPPSQIVTLQLTQREAFVLAQVDGVMRYEDILDVCGGERLEVLYILTKLLSRGVIGPK